MNVPTDTELCELLVKQGIAMTHNGRYLALQNGIKDLLDFARAVLAAAAPAVVQAEPSEEVSYELIQDDCMVAATMGGGAYEEILRYAAQYIQDGRVEIVKCVRTTLPTLEVPT